MFRFRDSITTYMNKLVTDQSEIMNHEGLSRFIKGSMERSYNRINSSMNKILWFSVKIKINFFHLLIDLFNSNLEQIENGIDESEKDHQTIFDIQRTSFVKARDKINRSITTIKVSTF